MATILVELEPEGEPFGVPIRKALALSRVKSLSLPNPDPSQATAIFL